MDRQCSSCGGFCRKSGCERENVKPEQKKEWVGLTDEETQKIFAEIAIAGFTAISITRAIEAKLKEKNT